MPMAQMKLGETEVTLAKSDSKITKLGLFCVPGPRLRHYFQSQFGERKDEGKEIKETDVLEVGWVGLSLNDDPATLLMKRCLDHHHRASNKLLTSAGDEYFAV